MKPHHLEANRSEESSEDSENSSNSSMEGLKGATVKPHNDLVEDAMDQMVNDGKVEATPGPGRLNELVTSLT